MNTPSEATVKKLRLIAFGVFAVPFVFSICSYFLSMIGFAPSEWMSDMDVSVYKYIIGTLFAGTTLIAYTLLSVIATNRTTGVLMRNVGIALAAIGIVKTLFYFFFRDNFFFASPKARKHY